MYQQTMVQAGSSFQFNLPVVAVTDIKIIRDDLALSTMGRSFWILDDISPLRQISRVGGGDVTALFLPRKHLQITFNPGILY